jgi:endonuclease/exonuclease/phosphatase family metal-dependent hydrolase
VLTGHLLSEHSPWKAIPFGARAASMGWHGNALLVRKDAQVVDCEAIHLPALEPRGAVMADIRIGGTIVRVVGMHLDLSGLWRRRQAHTIIAHLAASTRQRPTVLMGDLNDWSSNSGALRDFAHHFQFAPTGRSFHARKPVARLDRIMATRDLAITGAGVHDSPVSRTASDHLPVWATVEPA